MVYENGCAHGARRTGEPCSVCANQREASPPAPSVGDVVREWEAGPCFLSFAARGKWFKQVGDRMSAALTAQAAEVERLRGEVERLARKCQDRSEIVSERDALNAECSLLEARATAAESRLETARAALENVRSGLRNLPASATAVQIDEIARVALAALPSPPLLAALRSVDAMISRKTEEPRNG